MSPSARSGQPDQCHPGTMDNGPVWRGPWNRGQRCILPAAGFYEWHLNEAGQKHPVFIHLADQDVAGFAGLWDRSVRADGNNPHRMPAILAPAAYDAWLKGGAGEARAVLELYPQDVMVAYEVSTRVNSPKNNGEQLIEPVKRGR